jgi:hypothetical protein
MRLQKYAFFPNCRLFLVKKKIFLHKNTDCRLKLRFFLVILQRHSRTLHDGEKKDRAVANAFGISQDWSDEQIALELMRRSIALSKPVKTKNTSRKTKENKS